MERTQKPEIAHRDALKALILLIIPAILAAIYYFTSLSFQQALALDHTQPRLQNFWTNALVHEHQPGDRHLNGNIVGYLLLIFPCWILYIYRGQERRFWTGLAIILAIGPLVVSASSYIVFYELLGFEIENDRGFSGVVSALTGFLLVSLLHTFVQKQKESVAVLSMGFYFGSLILGLGVFTGRVVAVGLGVFIFIGMYAATRTAYVAPVVELSKWVRKNEQLGLVLVVAIVVSILGFAASLPSEITSGDGLTNIVAHGVGILFGMAVAGSFQYRQRGAAVEDSSTA